MLKCVKILRSIFFAYIFAQLIKTNINLIIKQMGTKNQKVLRKLDQLKQIKDFIDHNPNESMSTWSINKLSTNRLSETLKRNGLVLNTGNIQRPNWQWVAPRPNIVMAEKVLMAQREIERSAFKKSEMNKKKTIADVKIQAEVVKPVQAPVVSATINNTVSKRSMYIEAILELNPEIRLHNGIMVSFEGDSVLISKSGRNIKTNDPVLFKQIAQVVSL